MPDTIEKILGKETKTIAEALQGSLYDLLALGKVLKQAHWNVKGKFFKPVHEHLDAIYADVEEATDEVAERLSALGVSPSGQAPEVAKFASVKSIPLGFLRDEQVVELVTDRLGTACQTIRDRMAATEDPDPVTADILHGFLGKLEKHLWMLRSQME
ncbi:MAG: Dps family protein [Fimbriimonas sp.]